jgi:hypothetical protein
MKYIIFGCRSHPRSFIFPEEIRHSKAAQLYSGGQQIVSAGYFVVEVLDGDVSVTVYGSSTSLVRDSDPLDAEILRSQLTQTPQRIPEEVGI